jgi:hypothetical protein
MVYLLMLRPTNILNLFCYAPGSVIEEVVCFKFFYVFSDS